MTKTYTNAAAAYPEFPHTPAALTKYIEASGIFTIMLKTGAIVHFSPCDTDGFRNWLLEHNVPDIRAQNDSY